MARGKQQQTKKDGQHRAETKEERRTRLLREKEAKEVSESLKNLFDRRYPARDYSVVSNLLTFSIAPISIEMSKDPSLCHCCNYRILDIVCSLRAFSASTGAENSDR